MTPAETRVVLLRNGFIPTPVNGKAAVAKGWQTKTETNPNEIALWDRTYHSARNTGILCQRVPALDIDITVQPAAEAVEALAREEFEERGHFMVRIGRPPKRAILLRTDEPFEKVSASFAAPDGTQHKIEVLGDGQQVVVDGIHPDTGKPYCWHGGSPTENPRANLPYVRRDDVVAFLDKAADLLTREFGFQRTDAPRRPNGYAGGDNTHDRADWASLVSNIITGRDLHDSAARMAAAYIASGMDAHGAQRAVEALFLTSDTPRDERWKARFNDIGRATLTAWEKFKPAANHAGKDEAIADTSLDAIMNTKFAPIAWVLPGILVEGVTLLAAKPKIGKSWMLLHAGYAVGTGGFTLGELHCTQGDVLYCALEDNFRRIKSRVTKMFGPDAKGTQRMTVLCEMKKLAEGGLDQIKEWIGKAASPRLIVIDTLSMVRVSMKKNDTQFQADYDAVKDLRTLAAEHHVAIVLVHHLRKADSDDPFDTVNATLGLTAAVDSVLIIKRDSNGNHTLHGRGRDLVELEKAILFNKDTCTWTIIGEAAEVKQSADRNAIKAALMENQAEMSIQDLATATGMRNDPKFRMMLGRMAAAGQIERSKRGKYVGVGW